MSWTTEAIVIRGYKLLPEILEEFLKKSYNEEGYEDYIIDTNPISEDGEIFFGIITHNIEADAPFKRIGYFSADDAKEYNMKSRFHYYFDEIYIQKNKLIPICETYIGVRYI